MTPRTFLIAFALLLPSGALSAQSHSRLSAALPLWADSALLKAGFWSGYDFTSRTSPEIDVGDLDGDGLWDVAIAVVDLGGRRRGIAIIHQIDRSVHILGAGRPLGNGGDELPSTTNWSVGALSGHRAGVRVVDRRASGWLVWNGRTYSWVPDSD